jgi:hypothetical protein
VHPWTRLKAHLEGLRDSAALLGELRSLARGLVIHGHLHRRIQRTLSTDAGHLLQVGATSASLHHSEDDRMAAFNLYDVSDLGLPRVESFVYSPEQGTFRLESVPKHV